MKLCWCTIMVKDLEASLRFYQEIVGLKIQRRIQSSSGMEIVFLSDGEMSEVELIHDVNATGYEGHGVSLGFETESLTAKMELMREKGVEIARGPFDVGGGTKFFYVKDPDGMNIQIVQNGNP